MSRAREEAEKWFKTEWAEKRDSCPECGGFDDNDAFEAGFKCAVELAVGLYEREARLHSRRLDDHKAAAARFRRELLEEK